MNIDASSPVAIQAAQEKLDAHTREIVQWHFSTESGCPFWEPGGAVLKGRCAFEQLDLLGRSELACELLRIRDALDMPASPNAEHEARSRFYRLLNESEVE